MRRTIVANSIPFTHRFHDLRCSYATYRLQSLLDAGIKSTKELVLLMQWMGHNQESTTWKYLHYLDRQDALKEKVSMLDEIMHSVIDGISDD
ncbi:hypothetical protein [Shewanella algae]|uniref:hypothetical protein n=1 Tax=Shewanella algae TaxID=38313 RepID=UPI001F31FAAB|nr:hypothetical protein [Shewanella algae]MCE9783090.1 hypothetical protein [Shewanella algae]